MGQIHVAPLQRDRFTETHAFPLQWFVTWVGFGYVIPTHYKLLDRVKFGAVGALVTLAVTMILPRRG